MKREIKITLHHDYLKIVDTRSYDEEENVKEIQMPIRTAKIIADMWEMSRSTEKDIAMYAVGSGSHRTSNPIYDVGVYVRGINNDNELGWISKKIKPILNK